MGVFMILMTFTATMINNFYSNSTQVQNSYSAFTQVLPASTAIEQFFRTIVEPAPSNAGQPVPTVSPTGPGGTSACPTTNFYLGPNCIQFTSNQGNANGPSLVTATTTANTTPAGTYTFTMTVQDPTFRTCPGSSTNPNFVSPYTSSTRCQYAASATRRVLQITNLTNGSPTAASPIFQYTLGTSTSPVPYSTVAGSSWVTNFGATSCTASSCPSPPSRPSPWTSRPGRPTGSPPPTRHRSARSRRCTRASWGDNGTTDQACSELSTEPSALRTGVAPRRPGPVGDRIGARDRPHHGARHLHLRQHHLAELPHRAEQPGPALCLPGGRGRPQRVRVRHPDQSQPCPVQFHQPEHPPVPSAPALQVRSVEPGPLLGVGRVADGVVLGLPEHRRCRRPGQSGHRRCRAGDDGLRLPARVGQLRAHQFVPVARLVVRARHHRPGAGRRRDRWACLHGQCRIRKGKAAQPGVGHRRQRGQPLFCELPELQLRLQRPGHGVQRPGLLRRPDVRVRLRSFGKREHRSHQSVAGCDHRRPEPLHRPELPEATQPSTTTPVPRCSTRARPRPPTR